MAIEPWRKHYVMLTLALALSGGVHGAPLLPRQEPASGSEVPPADACTIEGNNDFYGLGIRVGIYLQWATSLFVNHFLAAAIQGNLDTNTIFLLALFAALAASTLRQDIEAAEIVVLLHLCFGFVASILSIWGYRTSTRSREPVRFPLLGSFARLTLTTAICAYALWFWLLGIDNALERPCTTYTFLFGRLDAEGPVKHYFQASTIAFCVVYWFLFAKEFLMLCLFMIFTTFKTAALGLVYVVLSPKSPLQQFPKDEPSRRKTIKWLLRGLLFQIKTWPRLAAPIIWSRMNGKESAGEERPNTSFWLITFYDLSTMLWRIVFQFFCIFVTGHCPPVGFPPLIPPTIFDNTVFGSVASLRAAVLKFITKERAILVSSLNTACLIWAIIAVELTLYWNNITSVYDVSSTGQLIPLITGIVGLVRAVHVFTVEQSNVQATDTLMELLDRDTEESLEDDFDTYSMHDGTEAVFLAKRRPERRHSFGDSAPVAENDLSDMKTIAKKFFTSKLPNKAADVDDESAELFSTNALQALGFGSSKRKRREYPKVREARSLPDMGKAARPADPHDYPFLHLGENSSRSSSYYLSSTTTGSTSSTSSASSGRMPASRVSVDSEDSFRQAYAYRPRRRRPTDIESGGHVESPSSRPRGDASHHAAEYDDSDRGRPSSRSSTRRMSRSRGRSRDRRLSRRRSWSRSRRLSYSRSRSRSPSSSPKESRIKATFAKLAAEYREAFTERQVYRWSAAHPLRKHYADIVRKAMEDQEKKTPSGLENAESKKPRRPFASAPTRGPGVAAGKHKWQHRRRRHYGAASALFSRSLYELFLAVVRSAADARRRAGRYDEVARLDELVDLARNAKAVRRERLAHTITREEQHAKIVELWQKANWRIQGQLAEFLSDVVLAEFRSPNGVEEEKKEGSGRKGRKKGKQADGEGKEQEQVNDIRPQSADWTLLRRMRMYEPEVKKLYRKAQYQSFFTTGACRDISFEQWASNECIEVLSGSSSSDETSVRSQSRASHGTGSSGS